MKAIALYRRFIVVHLKTMMEYRFTFFMDMFIQVFTYVISYLGIWIILNRFHSINGWGFYEVMFLYNLNLFSYGVSGLFFWSPMLGLGGMVQSGTFDNILIRPMNPFLHLISRKFMHHFLGHLFLGTIVFIICFKNLSIEWTISKVLWFSIVMLGAVLIQSSLMIIAGTVSFWFVKSSSLVETTIYGLRRFLDYPISIYDKWVQVVLTFVIPYGFVNFYPARLFLNKTDGLFHPSFGYGAPVVGLALFLLAYRFWCFGIKHYQSTGS